MFMQKDKDYDLDVVEKDGSSATFQLSVSAIEIIHSFLMFEIQGESIAINLDSIKRFTTRIREKVQFDWTERGRDERTKLPIIEFRALVKKTGTVEQYVGSPEPTETVDDFNSRAKMILLGKLKDRGESV